MRVFEQDDLRRMSPQKEQKEEYDIMLSRSEAVLPWIEEERNAVTILRDDEPMVVLGVIPNPGCLEFWAIVSKNISRAGMVVATKNMAICQNAMRAAGHKSIMTPIRTDFEKGARWARLFGLKPTGKKEDILKNGIEYEYWRKEL